MSGYKYEPISGDVEIGTSSIEQPDELYVNGVTISSLIDGYEQESVTGRLLLAPEVETKRSKSRNGARLVSKSYPPREFEIKYILKNRTSTELREKIDKLMDILRGELEIKFKDSPQYIYKSVEFTGDSREEETSNTVRSSFTLTALDPYRYTSERKTTEVIDTKEDNIKVDEIHIEFSKTVKNPTILIESSGYGFQMSFKLSGEYKSGSIVKVIQSSNGFIHVEGGSIELGTLTEELVLHKGSKGVIGNDSNAGKVKFIWRDRRI